MPKLKLFPSHGKTKAGRNGYGEDAKEEIGGGTQPAPLRGLEARGHLREINQRLAQGLSCHALNFVGEGKKHFEGPVKSSSSSLFFR